MGRRWQAFRLNLQAWANPQAWVLAQEVEHQKVRCLIAESEATRLRAEVIIALRSLARLRARVEATDEKTASVLAEAKEVEARLRRAARFC